MQKVSDPEIIPTKYKLTYETLTQVAYSEYNNLIYSNFL